MMLDNRASNQGDVGNPVGSSTIRSSGSRSGNALGRSLCQRGQNRVACLAQAIQSALSFKWRKSAQEIAEAGDQFPARRIAQIAQGVEGCLRATGTVREVG